MDIVEKSVGNFQIVRMNKPQPYSVVAADLRCTRATDRGWSGTIHGADWSGTLESAVFVTLKTDRREIENQRKFEYSGERGRFLKLGSDFGKFLSLDLFGKNIYFSTLAI